MSQSTSLTDPEFLAKLERFAKWANRFFLQERVMSSSSKGKRGSGTLFREHRSYSPGDDFRNVDWNAYGRLGELFVKVFEPEERARLGLLLDVSPSMQAGNKLHLARQLAALLGYLGLRQLDQVSFHSFPGTGGHDFEGPRHIENCLREIESAKPQIGAEEADRNLGLRSRQAGLFFLISDFYPLKAAERLLAQLGQSRVVCVHLLHPQEQFFAAHGVFAFKDPETMRSRWIGVTSRLRHRYQELVEGHLRAVAKMAASHGARYLRISSDAEFESAALQVLRSPQWAS